MFKTFNLKTQFGPIDIARYFPLTQDTGNMLVAVLFVYVLGFAAYGATRVFFPQDA